MYDPFECHQIVVSIAFKCPKMLELFPVMPLLVCLRTLPNAIVTFRILLLTMRKQLYASSDDSNSCSSLYILITTSAQTILNIRESR